MAMMMGTNEACEALGVKPATLRRLARRGLVPAVKIGERWRYDVDGYKRALREEKQLRERVEKTLRGMR